MPSRLIKQIEADSYVAWRFFSARSPSLWIRRFALALTKEILGQVRSKFASIPIPGETLSLNGPALIQEARDDQDKLREELKITLDELTYAKLIEKDAMITDTARAIQEKVPLPIIVG